jgi:hypothetical protein
MKRYKFIVLIILFSVFKLSLFSIQRQGCRSYIVHDDWLYEVCYHDFESKVLPYIVKQLYHTASTYFYCLDKYNRNRKSLGLPPRLEPVRNAIQGDNEIPGVCVDYATHFINNYRGPGELFYIQVDTDGSATLYRRLKRFRQSDIVVNHTMSVNTFIENLYHRVISSGAREEGARFIWENEQNLWQTFYTYTRHGIIHWSSYSFNSQTTLIPFKREHISINLSIFLQEQNRQIKLHSDKFLLRVGERHRDLVDERLSSWGWGWSNNWASRGKSNELGEWYIGTYLFNSNKCGSLYLLERIPIPTPQTHAKETDINKFTNHAWVRIVWEGKIIDVEPTWFDNGREIGRGIIEIIGKSSGY